MTREHFYKVYSQMGLHSSFNPKQQTLETLLTNGNSFTILHNGEPIGIGGVVKVWEGVGEAWTCILPALRQERFFLHRVVKRVLNIIKVKDNLHRIHLYVLKGFYDGERWAQALGFKFEGELNQWGPRAENYRIFARLWPILE